jgi:hypothetical protein
MHKIAFEYRTYRTVYLCEFEAECQIALASESGSRDGVVWFKVSEGRKSRETVPLTLGLWFAKQCYFGVAPARDKIIYAIPATLLPFYRNQLSNTVTLLLLKKYLFIIKYYLRYWNWNRPFPTGLLSLKISLYDMSYKGVYLLCITPKLPLIFFHEGTNRKSITATQLFISIPEQL